MIKNFFNKLFNWVRAVRYWFATTSVFWLTLLVSSVALIFALRPGVSESTIRLTGMVMDALGLFVVLFGIKGTRQLFDQPSLIKRMVNSIRSFPTFRVKNVSGFAHFKSGGVTTSARGYATHGVKEDMSIEEKIEALKKNVDVINARIDSYQREADAEIRNLKNGLTDEKNTRASENSLIREKLEKSVSGGLHISLMGSIWLLIGIVLSNASQELYNWLS